MLEMGTFTQLCNLKVAVLSLKGTPPSAQGQHVSPGDTPSYIPASGLTPVPGAGT
jgi:hypothetical protein